MRVLILDFDFHSTLGGGQTFYRRLVERHPDWEFHYPSRGADLKAEVRATLPPNARPFAFDRHITHDAVVAAARPGASEDYYMVLLAQVAAAVQGRAFDLVELPSFLPIAHKVRPIFAAYGIVARRISLGLHGWLSVSIRNGYAGEIPEQDVINQFATEKECAAAADVIYVVSDLHATENTGHDRRFITVDMNDALETVAPPPEAPPGQGPPDLWYVGRLDRNKGPDIFIEMIARVPRELYGKVYLVGPDNPWAVGLRWSQEIDALATRLGVEAEYLGEFTASELRERVYAGRTVLVIPSRSDAFNYVSMEALLNGVPILLSKNAGAAGFLQQRRPDIAPPIIDPERVDEAADKLREVLESYPRSAVQLRRALRETPWTAPRKGFLAAAMAEAEDSRGAIDMSVVEAVKFVDPLNLPAATGWRSASTARRSPDVDVVLLASDDLAALQRSLVSLVGSATVRFRTVVVDSFSPAPVALSRLVRAFVPDASVLRQGPRGVGGALLTGLKAGDAPFVTVLTAGQGLDPDVVEAFADTLRAQPSLGAVYGAWQELDAAGVPVREHGSDALSRRALLLRDQPIPGPGALLRRSAVEVAGGVDATLGEASLPDLWVRLDDTGALLSSDWVAGWSWPEGRSEPRPASPSDTAEQQAARRRRLAGTSTRRPPASAPLLGAAT